MGIALSLSVTSQGLHFQPQRKLLSPFAGTVYPSGVSRLGAPDSETAKSDFVTNGAR